MEDNKALTRAKIIAALRCCGNTDTKRPDCEHCPLNGPMCVKRMLEGAAALLEHDAEPNDPLTLDELREMDGEPVWLHVADGVWGLVDADDLTIALSRGGSIDIGRLAGKAYRRKLEGGASIGVACQKTGRGYIGIDNDQHWYDVARERLGVATLEDGQDG